MCQEDIKSVKFTGNTPEACWRQYNFARLAVGFDSAHYPEIDHFWLHGAGKYTLILNYGRDVTPNM